MATIAVLYPAKPGSRMDLNYYRTKHIPLVKARWTEHGLESVTVLQTQGTADGSDPAYQIITLLTFPSMKEFGKAAKASGAEVMGDIPNFTDVTPQVQFMDALI